MQLPGLSSKSIVGLDIGSSCVKAVEVTTGDHGFELVSLGIAPIPPESIVQGAFLNSGAVVEAIREAMSVAGIKSKKVAAAVSGHSVIVKKIRMPAASLEELEESIQWEAEQYIPFDVNEVNLDFQILEESDSEGQMDVLLVAAKKDVIDDYVQVISEAGLTPSIIDIDSFAVENVFELSADASSDETVALVDVGAQLVNINIISQGTPLFTRDVSLGGNQYTEEIQKTLSIGFDEAEALKIGGVSEDESEQRDLPPELDETIRRVSDTMVGEISRSLDFFTATAAESRIQRILLCGGGCSIPRLAEVLEAKMGVPVERMNPLAAMAPTNRYEAEFLEQVGPTLAVGIGLALRRLDDR